MAGEERKNMIHQLKCEAQYFEDCVSGRKTFEVRKNDRNFHLGDYLALNELTKATKVETGRSALFHVIYILNDKDFVKEGYVVLGIEPCNVSCVGVGLKAEILEEGIYDGS